MKLLVKQKCTVQKQSLELAAHRKPGVNVVSILMVLDVYFVALFKSKKIEILDFERRELSAMSDEQIEAIDPLVKERMEEVLFDKEQAEAKARRKSVSTSTNGEWQGTEEVKSEATGESNNATDVDDSKKSDTDEKTENNSTEENSSEEGSEESGSESEDEESEDELDAEEESEDEEGEEESETEETEEVEEVKETKAPSKASKNSSKKKKKNKR